MNSSVITPGDVAAHMTASIGKGTLIHHPFPHHVTDDVLPAHIFERLVADLPDLEDPTAMPRSAVKSMLSYDNHRTALFDEVSGRSDPSVWRLVESAMLDSSVEHLLREVFHPLVPADTDRRAVKTEVRLNCGLAGSHLNPHTDSPLIILKMLIFLQAGAGHRSADTVLYRPKDPEGRLRALGSNRDFTASSYSHESIEDHIEATRVKFAANRMLSFFRTSASLHGLDCLAEEATPRFIVSAFYKFASE